jgi:hypothetical protein
MSLLDIQMELECWSNFISALINLGGQVYIKGGAALGVFLLNLWLIQI